MQSAATGEELAAFEQVYRDTRQALLAYLHRRAPADAADLLAEVYLVAWRRRDVLPAGEQQRLWLYGIARRLLAEHHRTRADHASLDTVGEAVLTPWREGRDGETPRAAAVRQVLAELNDTDRELLTLTTWEHLSTTDAAHVVGITAGSARVRLHRARRKLREHPSLRTLLDEPSPHLA
ncbi:RNA polymerase, sigma-24 subunit, ECF subfamily [Kineococcus radiotolerans SRS30216 = ATCC BAA-149]|uniref:RNA polymerase, sigma-24 subunit, ECF subfamily n=1 Tax=Kineococcus radiotolerans (strain ATCC BAA-149 / DSM 14245 / SRS30216) TaxID=266940 RepID=A6WAB7_KINRD|nr:RNA polymerase, sigma-24 subunit, ECF subfamily [Kineococcus radiotolerans SRS30216 = ATCC BAA-149]